MKKTSLFLLLCAAASSLQAATFTSAGSGNWENPATWTAGVGSPNPFMADSAVIDAGHTVSYNGVGTAPFPGGNLVVANSNSITINGGTLTQIWAPGAPPPFGTAIAIGVSGPVNGTGTLSINSGGTFDSGTANAVAVGITVNALALGTTGNGTVNVNDGIFRLGAASSGPGGSGLAIGIDQGATGVFNVGDGAGAAGSATLDLVTNNSLLTVGGRLNDPAGGTGTLNILLDGLVSGGTNEINVGDNLGVGTLNINGGTLLGGTGAINFGTSGGTGTLQMITGALGSSGNIIFGEGSTSVGTGNIIGGSVGTTADVIVGLQNAAAAGNSVLNIADTSAAGLGITGFGQGTGSLSANNLTIGQEAGGTGGKGVLNVNTTGSVVANSLRVGQGVGSVGVANIEAGNVNASAGPLYVGFAGGTGTMNLAGGTVSANIGEIGQGTGIGGTAGTLNITGGVLNFTNHFNIGQDNGVGVVNQTGGVVNLTNEWVAIGLGGGPTGSKWDISGGQINSNVGMEIGADREGTMNISGTAVVNAPNFQLGNRDNSNGIVNQTGGAVTLGQLFISGDQSAGTGTYNYNGGTLTANDLYIGKENGTFNITNGTFTHNAWGEIGRFGGTGVVNVDGPNANWLHTPAGGDLQIGYTDGNNPGGSTATVNVKNGGQMTYNWWINIARGVGNNGQRPTGTFNIDGTGSHVIHGTGGQDLRLNVGEDGTGFMNVTNGGVYERFAGAETAIGRNGGAVGTLVVDGAGSLFKQTSGDILVGGSGTGTLSINNNGVVEHTNGWMYVGTWQNGNAPSIGNTVNITNGGVLKELRPGGDMHIRIGNESGTEGVMNIDSGGSILGWADEGTLGNPDGDTGARLYLGIAGANGAIAAAKGTLNLINGTVNVLSLTPGENGEGIVNQVGGVMNVAQLTEIGQGRAVAQPAGKYNMTGGIFNTGSLGVGSRREGEMTVGGTGIVNVSGWGNLHVGLYGQEDVDVNDANNGGVSHATGTLTIKDTGVVNSGNETNVGHQAGTVGTLTVTDSGVLNQGGSFLIGRRGTGTVNLGGNGQIIQTGGETTIGFETNAFGGGGNGTLNMSGGVFRANGWTRIGNNDKTVGVMNMTGGVFNDVLGDIAGVEDRFVIGQNDGATGTLNISGGILNTLSLTVSDRGDATINQTGGTINVSQWTDISQDRGVHAGFGKYNMSGGVLNSPEVSVGSRRYGEMALSGTGVINTGNFWVGRFGVPDSGSAGDGLLNMTGGAINASADFIVGQQDGSKGVVNQAGGEITTANWYYVGRETGSQGSSTHVAGTVNIAQQLRVGNDGTGSMTVDGSATINISTTGVNPNNYVGVQNAGDNVLNVNGGTVNFGAGATMEVAWGGQPGEGASKGTWNVSGGNINGNPDITIARGGLGTMNISGGTTTFRAFHVTTGVGTGTVNVTNGTLAGSTNANEGYMNIGENNSTPATFNQTGGVVSFNSWMTIGIGAGANDPSVSKYLISGGDLTSPAGMEIGSDHGGTFDVSGTATVAVASLSVGTFGDRGGGTAGNGVMNVSGGSVNSGSLVVGHNSNSGAMVATGLFNQSGGETAIAGDILIATNINTAGTLNHTGGTLTAGGVLNMGNLANTPLFTTTGDLNIAPTSTELGEVNVGTTSTVNGGTANVAGNLYVNTPGAITLTGDLNVNNGTPLGTATAGNVNVSGGLARVNGTANVTGVVNVGATGTLGGTGTVNTAAVNIVAGGSLAPGSSPGTLTINGPLNIAAGGILAYELGPVAGPNDLTVVNGATTVGGAVTLNVSPQAGWDSAPGGIYTLIDSTSQSINPSDVTIGSGVPVNSAHVVTTHAATSTLNLALIEHNEGSFTSGIDTDTGSMNLGVFLPSSGSGSQNFSVYNLGGSYRLTLDGAAPTITGDTGLFTFDNGTLGQLAPGDSKAYNVAFNGTAATGTYTLTFTWPSSSLLDNNSAATLLSGHTLGTVNGLDNTGGSQSGNLVYTITATVAIPEPAAPLLAGLALLGMGLRRRRR